MFKKWWVILIQGILMFILGIFIFNNPLEVLAGISLWSGILILLTGVTGILGWMLMSKEQRETGSLIWSILSLAFGLIILFNVPAAMKVITIIFGIWVIITGFNLLSSGWSIKNNNSIGWILVIVGILSLVAGFMMIFNIGSGAAGVAVLLGLQVMLAGVALIFLSFVKKAIEGKVQDKIKEIKSKI